MNKNNTLIEVKEILAPYIKRIETHPLYAEIETLKQLRFFVEQHVFVVWDFMCLLRSLYAGLVCQTTLWSPPIDAFSAHLIGEMIVEEESDISQDRKTYHSHFELYLNAMEQIGANTSPVRLLIEKIKKNPNSDFNSLFDGIKMLPSTKFFLQTTLRFTSAPTHQIASAFVFGREAITSTMFTPILERIRSSKALKQPFSEPTGFIYYFSRHIDLDSNEHYPKALKMLKHLIKNKINLLDEVKEAAIEALNARQIFLTGIYENIHER